MGTLDARLTDIEEQALYSEDVYEIYNIFEDRDSASMDFAERARIPVEEANEMWTNEIVRFSIPGEPLVAAITFDKEKHIKYCLFSTGRVAIVEFY